MEEKSGQKAKVDKAGDPWHISQKRQTISPLAEEDAIIRILTVN